MSLTHEECSVVAEALAERAAIREHDGGETREQAEAAARSAMRVYRVRVGMGPGQSDRGVVLLAPECDIGEATRLAQMQFGTERVVSVTQEWDSGADMAVRRDRKAVDEPAWVTT